MVSIDSINDSLVSCTCASLTQDLGLAAFENLHLASLKTIFDGIVLILETLSYNGASHFKRILDTLKVLLFVAFLDRCLLLLLQLHLSIFRHFDAGLTIFICDL